MIRTAATLGLLSAAACLYQPAILVLRGDGTGGGDAITTTCDDNAHNGDETDVDCGGICPTCNVGSACIGGSDCGSTYCTASGICAEPTCSDAVLNGDETGIDCGGGCPTCIGFCGSVTEIPRHECQALEKLYEETTGDEWLVNTGWLTTSTPCSWFGVTCSMGHVSVVSLDSNVLAGLIPPELGNLTNLTDLSLYDNALTGPIPTALGNLINLTELSLANNQLEGAIPPELRNLTRLTELRLNGNVLTGLIPPELGDLILLNSSLLSQRSGSVAPTQRTPDPARPSTVTASPTATPLVTP